MGNAVGAEVQQPAQIHTIEIERNNVRNERMQEAVSAQRKLTPKEEERLNEKREQLRVIREQNKALTLRTRQRLEMSQKLTQEYKARVVFTEDDTGNHKGMLRRHARPNMGMLSPQKKKEYNSAVKIQSVWRGYCVRSLYGKMGKRTKIARELLQTEKDYIHYLTALVTVYYLPLKNGAESDSPLLTLEEVRTIFPQLEMILLYNHQLYDVLDKRIKKTWNADTTIADAFLALIDFLKPPYTHYISNFPLISQQIKEVSKRLRVAMFFQECKALPECAGLDLAALASMPFQRIPRYILLLKEMLANTKPKHPDYAPLKEAISKMDVLAKTANEKLREQESSRTILEIAKRLDPPIGNLMIPHRKLVREGTMRYKLQHATRKINPGFHNGVIFLFTDCLLVTEPITISVAKILDSNAVTKLRPIEVLSLNNSAVLDIMEDYKDRNAKCYDFRVHGLQATVIFEVDAMVLKESWMNDIAGAINSLTENAISYKSRHKRKSRVYSSISRKSTSVRIPTTLFQEAIIEEDVQDHPLSATPPSPLATRPYSHSSEDAAPPTTLPTIPHRPAQSVFGSSAAFSPAPRRSVMPGNANSPVLSSFLSHQRYTVSLSSENLSQEYPVNINQSRGLYIDNSPPAHRKAELKEELRRIEERRKAVEAQIAAEEEEERKKDEAARKREDRKQDGEKSTGGEKKEEGRKKYMSVHDIARIILENDYDESDASSTYSEDGNNNALRRETRSESFQLDVETYDEMAIRITNSLDQQRGITRTNSENEITRRHSVDFEQILPRSNSLSSLDGFLSGKYC